jgi:hypothetical protein
VGFVLSTTIYQNPVPSVKETWNGKKAPAATASVRHHPEKLYLVPHPGKIDRSQPVSVYEQPYLVIRGLLDEHLVILGLKG